MNLFHHPIRMTLFMGLVFAILFIPFIVIVGQLLNIKYAIQATLWCYTTLYVLYLTKYLQLRIHLIVFPLFFAGIMIISNLTFNQYILLLAGMIGWIRSGLSKQKHRIIVEIIIFSVTGVWFSQVVAGHRMMWCLNIWMFFLIQSLYFVFDDAKSSDQFKVEAGQLDPFIKLQKQMEEIIS
ncbi:MAG: hypothetical protein HQK77_14400 [Desulfobacterales bacterium]|nr:hypothetical protein [Desulfobacterales bacterium]